MFFGDSEEEVPGKNIILPKSIEDIRLRPVNMENLKRSLIKNIVTNKKIERVTELDLFYLMEEVHESYEFVNLELQLLGVKVVI